MANQHTDELPTPQGRLPRPPGRVRPWHAIAILLVAGCGSSPPPLDEGELAVVAARAAAYEAGEPLAAAKRAWEYATPWERRRVVFAEILSGFAGSDEPPPESLSRAFFVSMSLAREDAPPLAPEQRAFADRLADQTRGLFDGVTYVVDDSVSTSMDGVPVEYISRRGRRIQVTRPSPGQRVVSPLRIEGRAPISWIHEGAFPGRIVDDEGNLLGSGTLRALGDGTTSEHVPFEAEITFSAPDSGLGWLHLEKANPSGLPENDDHAEIPVTFGAG